MELFLKYCRVSIIILLKKYERLMRFARFSGPLIRHYSFSSPIPSVLMENVASDSGRHGES